MEKQLLANHEPNEEKTSDESSELDRCIYGRSQ